MANVKQNYLNNVRSQIQNEGVDLDREPILNFSSHFDLTNDTVNNRNTISINESTISNITQFTSSVGDTTLYTNIAPRFANANYISSGSQLHVTASLKQNTLGNFSARAVMHDSSGLTVRFVEGLNIVFQYISGSSANILTQYEVYNEYLPTTGTLSASIDGSNNLVVTLSSWTGSNYYGFVSVDGNELLLP